MFVEAEHVRGVLVWAALSSSNSTGRTSPGHLERHVIPVLTRIAKEISTELGG